MPAVWIRSDSMRKTFRTTALPLLGLLAIAVPSSNANLNYSDPSTPEYRNAVDYKSVQREPVFAYIDESGPVPYWSDIKKASKALGLDRSTIAAVAQIESGFRSGAQSEKGAKSVWQLTMPAFIEISRLVNSNDPYYVMLREKYPAIVEFAAPCVSGSIPNDWERAVTDVSTNSTVCMSYLALRARENSDLKEGLKDYNCGHTGKLVTDFDDEYVRRFNAAQRKLAFLDSSLYDEKPIASFTENLFSDFHPLQ